MEVIGVVTAGLAFATALKDVIEVAIKLKTSFDSVPFCIQSLKNDADGIVLLLRDIETVKQQHYAQVTVTENEMLPDLRSLSRGLSELHSKHTELLTNVLSPGGRSWPVPGFRSAQKALRTWYRTVKNKDDVTRLRSLAASLQLRYQVITTARIHADVRLLVDMNLALIRETPGGRRAIYHRNQIKLMYAELLRDPDTSRTLSSLWLHNTMALLASYEGEQHNTFRLLDQSFEHLPYLGTISISKISYNSAQNIYLCQARHERIIQHKGTMVTITTSVAIGASFCLPLTFDELQLPPMYIHQETPVQILDTNFGSIHSGLGKHMKIHLRYDVSVCWSSSSMWPESDDEVFTDDTSIEMEQEQEQEQESNGWEEIMDWEPQPHAFTQLLTEEKC